MFYLCWRDSWNFSMGDKWRWDIGDPGAGFHQNKHCHTTVSMYEFVKFFSCDPVEDSFFYWQHWELEKCNVDSFLTFSAHIIILSLENHSLSFPFQTYTFYFFALPFSASHLGNIGHRSCSGSQMDSFQWLTLCIFVSGFLVDNFFG